MNQCESMNDFRVLSRVHFRVQYRAQYREHSSIVCRGHFSVHLSLLINRLLGCSAGIICFLRFSSPWAVKTAHKGAPNPKPESPDAGRNLAKNAKTQKTSFFVASSRVICVFCKQKHDILVAGRGVAGAARRA